MAAAAAVAEARKAWQQQGLPISTETSVPLSDVLHKCVQNAYRRLQDLMEILPNHTIPNISRMRQVLDYVVTQRRYLIRLLILVRWAQKCSEPMQHAMNVHAFLTTKDREYEDAANALVAIHAASRRLPARMFDVVTAIDVLTVRGATRLPMIVRQRATEVQPLLPHERDATLKQLALMMGARCLYSHILPRPMRRAMRFTAGCTVFDLPNEFYLALTTTSHDPAVPWRVVKFRFACIPNLSPAHMARLHQTFERILATGETAAAEKPLATTTATPEGEASAKTPVTETKVTSASTAVMPEEALSVTQKPTENTGAIDAVTDPAAIMAAPQHREEHVLVLMRLYNFIHGFCLRYTLETLAAKVAELSTFRWQGHLQTKYDPQQSLLEVRYWTTSGLIQTTLRESERAIPTTSKGHGSARRTGAAPALREVLGGVFTIKIQPSLHHADHGDLSEFGALETISQNLFGSEKHDDLCVNVYASRLKGMDRAPVDATVAAAAELLVDGVDPTCLKAQQWTVDLAQADMEAVLLQVVALKSMACLRYLEEALVACRTQTPSAATKPSRTAADDHHLAIGKHWMTDNTLCIELLPDRDLLSIMIDAHSGKLQVLERSKQPLYQFFETMLNTTLDLPAALRWLQQGRLVQSWGHFAQVLGSSVTQHLDVAGLDGILDRLHEPAGGAAGDRTGARRAGMDAVAPSPSPWTDADRSMTFQLFIQVEADEWYLHVAAAPTSGTFDVSILRLAPPRDNGEPRRDAADILALDPAIVGLDHWRDTSIAAMQALQTRVLAFTRQTRLLQQLEAKGLQYLLSWRTNGETYGLTCPLHPADPTVAVAAPDAVAQRDAAYRAAHQQARLALTLQTGAVVVPAAPFMPFSPLAFFVHGNLALGEMIGSEAQLPLASLPPIDADPRMALSQWLQTQSPLSATKASMDTDAKTEINAKPSEDTGGAASRLEEEDQIYLQGDACLHIACPSLDRLILAWRRVAWVLQLAMDYHAQQPLFDRAGVSLVAFSVSRLQLRLDAGSLLEVNVHSGTPLLTAPPAAAASAAAAAPTSPSAPEPKGALAASLKPMVTTMAHPAFRDALVKALTLPPAQPPASPAAEPPAVAEEATTPLLASLRSVRRLRQLYDWVMTHGPRELVAFPSSPSSDGSPSAGAAAWTVALPALSLLDVQFGPVAHLLIRLLPNGDSLVERGVPVDGTGVVTPYALSRATVCRGHERQRRHRRRDAFPCRAAAHDAAAGQSARHLCRLASGVGVSRAAAWVCRGAAPCGGRPRRRRDAGRHHERVRCGTDRAHGGVAVCPVSDRRGGRPPRVSPRAGARVRGVLADGESHGQKGQ
ncbi:MED14-domain-containing protein [Caulochytrium protostelioides]|uniref:Mediator of RNA polymerase II transcription subunit 14 n=1 Tax=Caulochytrium protostelioides TaxID=1555241 RepID=A0A4P9WZG7_9FUNG|nr:MED14-domain-containing protein [Caulochytrium protostelioides]